MSKHMALPASYSVLVTPTALVIHPNAEQRPRRAYEGRAVRFEWRLGARAELVSKWKEPDGVGAAAEASPVDDGKVIRATVEGVMGVLKLFHDSHLLLVASSTVAGSLLSPGRTAFGIESILAVPLDRPRARQVLVDHDKRQRKRQDDSDSDLDMSDLSDLYASDSEAPEADEDPAPTNAEPSKPKRSLSGLRTLGLGRYLLARSRPKKTPTPPPLPTPPLALAQVPDPSPPSPVESVDPADLASRLELDQKIVREIAREAKGLMFARDWDITRRLQAQMESQAPAEAQVPVDQLHETLRLDSYEGCLPRLRPDVPLHRQADRGVWWNRFISRQLVDAQADEFVMVLAQGFFQSAEFDIPSPSSSETLPIRLTLVSRRSTSRPGLRYQRRGLDSSGSVANAVETEFIIGAKIGDRHLVASYVQIRGSIPLFWSQSPWALKPPPVLEREPDENRDATRLHFQTVAGVYGPPIICVCLAEDHGIEGKVVNAYDAAVHDLYPPSDDKEASVRFLGWDFHRKCKGMAYGNIRQLLDQMSDDLQHQGYFWTGPAGTFSKQHGVCRVNCIDCLDRTNVVQSALAKHMLTRHLVHLGVGVTEDFKDAALDGAFNELWANNGDAISRQYAGTSALKGDFVRTGKRDWRGVVNDATNSVGRLWQNTIADFFKQACIDYVLGVNLAGFAEFQESLTATDPGEILRLGRIRAVAIETTSRHVLPEDEPTVGAWTLLGPMEAGALKGCPFEEKVVLLTKKAVLVCSYEYKLQKVRDFTRIPLADVESIQKGPYILSTFTEAARSPVENHGFVLTFRAAAAQERLNNYTLSSAPPASELQNQAPGETSFFAFKAMRRTLVEEGEDVGTAPSGRKVIEGVVASIIDRRADLVPPSADFVKESPIVSLAEAERATTLLDRVAQRAKHFIWL